MFHRQICAVRIWYPAEMQKERHHHHSREQTSEISEPHDDSSSTSSSDDDRGSGEGATYPVQGDEHSEQSSHCTCNESNLSQYIHTQIDRASPTMSAAADQHRRRWAATPIDAGHIPLCTPPDIVCHSSGHNIPHTNSPIQPVLAVDRPGLTIHDRAVPPVAGVRAMPHAPIPLRRVGRTGRE